MTAQTPTPSRRRSRGAGLMTSLSRPEAGPAARWRPGDLDPLAEGLLGSFPAARICGERTRATSPASGAIFMRYYAR